VKTLAGRKLPWALLLGCCLALWLAGCAPRIYETPYIPPPPPPKPAPPPVVSRPVFYVSATRLNLRGCAGMDCPKISVLEQNEAVEKLGEMDDWFEVIVKRDGRRGWVTSRYLSPEPVTPTPEVPPPLEAPPALAPLEKPPPPAKSPVVEKPKPAKPEAAPAPPKKKAEEATEPARKPAPPPEKPAPPEKPTPIKEPEPEQPKKIRIM
jgi:hypothetical protein